MDLAPETILNNRYRIIRQLGKGGMGAVYLAYDTSLEIEVAVKLNYNPSQTSTSQFLQEARLLASLRHPNLPKVTDYFVNGENQYLVMDYVAGEDLSKVIEQQGALPLEQVLLYAEQLGEALTYLHSQQPPVIHRDIKPANIKLTLQGDIKLVDFGIAKAAETSQHTATGALGYTPGFAPPEQYGSQRTGPYSDQYALAATLYMLLTGQKPVDSVQRILGQATLTPINLLNPSVPANVQAAIERGMSSRIEERFPTIKEFTRALMDSTYQPTQLAALQTVSTAFSTDATHLTPRPLTQPPLPPISAPPAASAPAVGRPHTWIWFLIGGLVLLGLIVVVAGGVGAFFFFKPTQKPPTSHPSQVALLQKSTLTQPEPASAADATETPEPASTVLLAPTYTDIPVKAQFTSATQTPPATQAPLTTPTLEMLGSGGLVAFSSDRADGKTLQIWTMRVGLDSNGLPQAVETKQLTDGPGNKTQPIWSPDGSKLVYSAPGGKNEKGEDLGLDLWILDMKNPQAVAVDFTLKTGDDADPSWSPDGKWIAYSNNGRSDALWQIYIQPVAGGVRQRLSYDFEEKNPTWSPNMKWIVFVINANDHRYLYMRNEKLVYSTPVPFDTAEIFGRAGEVSNPAFSPDGSQIAFTQIDGSILRICTVAWGDYSRGDKITRLTDTTRDLEPQWSPDGKWIVFTSERDHNAEVYFMTSTGLLQTNLTGNPARDMQPAWQP